MYYVSGKRLKQEDLGGLVRRIKYKRKHDLWYDTRQSEIEKFRDNGTSSRRIDKSIKKKKKKKTKTVIPTMDLPLSVRTSLISY